MKIKELKEYIDEAYTRGKECDVEFWLKLEDDVIMCDLESIGQFNIIPDMTITIKIADEQKVYSTKKLTKEQIDYRKKYEELSKTLEEIRALL